MRNIFVITLLAGSALSSAAYAQDNNASEVEADVIVEPDAPAIKMNVPEPTVEVDQAAPDVFVSQPQPIITMTQPAPTITVDIPKPTITVRMPDPNVNVDMAQPEVSVSQGEPTVAIDDSGNAAVAVADDTDQANVTVEQANANVQLRQSNQRPQISYEREHANVVVNQEVGAPEIIYQNADGSPMADTGNTAAAGQQQSTATDNETMAINPSAPGQREVTVAVITDYDVMDATGEALGEIDEVVKIGNRLFAVVEVGGVLGIGEKQVAIPLSSLVATESGMTAPNVSKSQVEALEDFDDDQYAELEDGMIITVGEQ
ncbi:PRC-barrel domain-containing protein [Aurantimonas sp. A2-1-M11]|uniref:PRC-barrel domain-containing protein n=1 Tax=Aurantimonas sp. A2-1-M11 TaxID=3113712 RepID=UPI002F958B48